MSEDTVDSQKKFKDEQKLPFTLVADSDGKVADAFGVPVTMGRAKRQSFIVKEGKIAWVSPQAKTNRTCPGSAGRARVPELESLFPPILRFSRRTKRATRGRFEVSAPVAGSS